MKFWVIAIAASLAASGAFAKPHKHRKHAATKPVAEAAPRDPNGVWNIESTTSVGNCASLIPNALTIADNKLTEGPAANVTVWGYVDERGSIVARFTGEGEHVARFHGVLKGGKGSGAWSSSTDMCGGSWRGAQE